MTTNNTSHNMHVSGAFASKSLPDEALEVRYLELHTDQVEFLKDYLIRVLPYCYITRKILKTQVKNTKLKPSMILANKIPDRGSVMSGDFGEILTLLFLNCECSERTFPIKKWRYKQDRTKAVPHSDVVILYRKFTNGKASKDDFVICAESKQKSTNSKFDPIRKAIEGYKTDRTGRLARTLVWLKEKAIDSGTEKQIKYIERFTELSKVEYSKYYKAVAVIDLELVFDEITRDIELPSQNAYFEVLVLGIPDLKDFYETVFQRAIEEVEIDE